MTTTDLMLPDGTRWRPRTHSAEHSRRRGDHGFTSFNGCRGFPWDEMADDCIPLFYGPGDTKKQEILEESPRTTSARNGSGG